MLLRAQQPGEERPRDRPAVRGDEAERDVRIHQVGILGDQHEIAQRRQAAAEPHRRTVHRRDDRDLDRQHRPHQGLGLVHDRGAHVDVVDHLLQQPEAAARAERRTGAGEHDGAGIPVGGELLPDGGDRVVELGVGGVEGVGPVEGDEPYRAVGLDQYRIGALWLCHVTPGPTKSLWYDNSPPSVPTRLEATMTATHPSTITVEPIAGALGAEISGVDLASRPRRRDRGRDPARVARPPRRLLPRPGPRARRVPRLRPADRRAGASTRS